jgi:hypothetical protein
MFYSKCLNRRYEIAWLLLIGLQVEKETLVQCTQFFSSFQHCRLGHYAPWATDGALWTIILACTCLFTTTFQAFRMKYRGMRVEVWRSYRLLWLMIFMGFLRSSGKWENLEINYDFLCRICIYQLEISLHATQIGLQVLQVKERSSESMNID